MQPFEKIGQRVPLIGQPVRNSVRPTHQGESVPGVFARLAKRRKAALRSNGSRELLSN